MSSLGIKIFGSKRKTVPNVNLLLQEYLFCVYRVSAKHSIVKENRPLLQDKLLSNGGEETCKQINYNVSYQVRCEGTMGVQPRPENEQTDRARVSQRGHEAEAFTLTSTEHLNVLNHDHPSALAFMIPLKNTCLLLSLPPEWCPVSVLLPVDCRI